MKTIQLPKNLHPFLGKKITLMELVVLIMISTAWAFYIISQSGSEFEALGIVSKVIIILMVIDLAYGFFANVLSGVKTYYQEHPRLKKIFVFLHIYPIITVIIAGVNVWYGIWVYALIAASSVIIQFINKHFYQQVLAYAFIFLGVYLFKDSYSHLPDYVNSIFILLSLKLILGFSVDANDRIKE